MEISRFGTPVGPMIRVDGGFANRMYRLDTDQGSFAVKELNRVDRRWPYQVEDVFRFERAAFAAGVPMPEPIAADPDLLVHRWVAGEKLPEASVSAAYGFEIGEILARIHTLDVAWPHGAIEEPVARDWPDLAERAVATGQPWDDIDAGIFRSVLDGYVAAGGVLPPSGPSWFVYMIDGWLGHTRWNILRCLSTTDAPSGPDRSLSHESVHNALTGLPALFNHLPNLETLL